MKNKSINLKSLALATLFILVCVCLCGCAEVNFVTYHNPDGTIQEYILLNIDEYALQTNGYNPAKSKLEIKTNSYAEATLLLEQYQSKINIQFQNNSISAEEYSKLFNGVKIIENEWNEGQYLIGFQFENSTIYKNYYEIMNGVSFNNNTKEVKKLFYTKTYYYGTANYGDYSIFYRVYNYYANSKFAKFSPTQTNLTYTYTVSSKRFHSDADKVTFDTNGIYLHTWNISPTNPSRKICIYTISANRAAWFITCLIIGLIISVILCLTGLIIYHKNRKTSTENTADKSANNLTEN